MSSWLTAINNATILLFVSLIFVDAYQPRKPQKLAPANNTRYMVLDVLERKLYKLLNQHWIFRLNVILYSASCVFNSRSRRSSSKLRNRHYKDLTMSTKFQLNALFCWGLMISSESWFHIIQCINLLNLHNILNCSNPTHITLHCQINSIGVPFFAFLAQLPQLTKDEVKECHYDFLSNSFGGVAHLPFRSFRC